MAYNCCHSGEELTIMPSDDLTNLLQKWPLERGGLQARVVQADDGRDVLQIRLDLGILQMDMDGRPDGGSSERERLLNSGVTTPLDADTCRLLREEAVQRSHRAAACLSLGLWEMVVRDASATLEILDLCRHHGSSEDDRRALEPFRGSAIAMRARGRSEWAVGHGQRQAALSAIDQGLEELAAALGGAGGERSHEALMLLALRQSLTRRLPVSERADLRERLQGAIDAQNFELAAILRDELRLLRG
jgi:hypothetical protein